MNRRDTFKLKTQYIEHCKNIFSTQFRSNEELLIKEIKENIDRGVSLGKKPPGVGVIRKFFAREVISRKFIELILDALWPGHVNKPLEEIAERDDDGNNHSITDTQSDRLKELTSSSEIIIRNRSKNFVGREHVFSAFASFMQENSRGYFSLIAEPGEGKSAIAARLIKEKYPGQCLYYFNVRGRDSSSARFRESISRQLIAFYSLKEIKIPPDAWEDENFFNAVLLQASDRLNPGEKIIVVVDALDEAPEEARRDVNVLRLPRELPDKVYIFLTYRRYAEQLKGRVNFFHPSKKYDLDPEIPGMKERCDTDIRTYLDTQLHNDSAMKKNFEKWIALQKAPKENVLNDLVNLTAGNFLFITLILPHVAVDNGVYQNKKLKELPKSFDDHYNEHWKKQNPTQDEAVIIFILWRNVSGEGSGVFRKTNKCTGNGVSTNLLAKDTGLPKRMVDEVIGRWGEFLEKEVENEQLLYRFFHLSYNDWVIKKAMEEFEETKETLSQRILINRFPPDFNFGS